jgi:hypothetical protein
MASSNVRVARLTRMATWRALAGTQVIGEANGILRPDRRWFISVDTWIEDSFLALVPTGPDQTHLAAGALPAGMSLVSADAVDEDGLRLLDEALRQDVPGSDGWVNDPQEFREYTFSEWRFDPATYLVAVDDASPVLTWSASRPGTAARAWPRYCSPRCSRRSAPAASAKSRPRQTPPTPPRMPCSAGSVHAGWAAPSS